MSTIELLVDPELRDALAQQLPPLTAESLTQRRANALELAGSVPRPNLPDIATDEIHGGGFVMGAPEMKDVENRLFASELKCAICSVDHRLAPESPHPAPVEDIYSVFAWLHGNAGQLGLDPTRIGIKGESGGGGFAAAAALYARDRQGPKIRLSASDLSDD
jgi:acetyl esterase/lipase